MINSILICTAATFLGALIFRMRGGLGPNLPRPIDQLLFASAYGGAIVYTTDNYYLTALGIALCTLAVVKGHGHNMDLGTYTKEADYEWYEFIIKPLHRKIPEYWYDFIGLAISGLTYTVPVGIIMMNPLVALSGALKAPAYALGWLIGKGTELGEWLTGAFLWGSLAIIVLYL